MTGWAVGGTAFAGIAVWAVIWSWCERRRQRAWARTRPPLNALQFCGQLTDEGIDPKYARYLWDELQLYYLVPLTPYPADRIYGDIKIDPDDISDIVLRFEKRFDVWLGEVRIACPDDPTIAELAVALQKAGQ